MIQEITAYCRLCGKPSKIPVCALCALKHAESPIGLEGETALFAAGEETAGAEPGARHFGPYRIIRVLGEGGFGTVYLARQTHPIRRHVALKVLKKGVGSGKHLLARFDLERQALARMEHPSICRVFDAGESASGEPYFVMEVVDGLPINRYCQEKRLPLAMVLTLFRQVCGAVDHAHQRGIIHRDLKPSNVLIAERDGEPYPVVIDFGIAKAIEPLLESDTILTLSFQIIGTPVYMSPEQADSGGHDADVRSDVYALGAMLYELLTGQPPIPAEEFRKIGIAAALRMISEVDTPPPSTRLTRAGGHGSGGDAGESGVRISARRLRGELDWITLKALAKDRNRRYQSARELAEDLVRFSDGRPVVAGPPGVAYRIKKFARRHPAGIAAAVAAVAVAGVSVTARAIQTGREARLAGEHLLAADSSAGPFVLAEAAPHLDRLRPTLERAADDASAPLQARIHASLALAGGDPGEVRRLCRLLLGTEGARPADPDQAAALQAGIIRTPEAVPASVAGEAARLAGDPALPVARRLGAAALLAGAVPESQVWDDLAPEVARLACSIGGVDAARWAHSLEPVAKSLLPPLRAIFEAESETPAGLGAALVLAGFYRGQATALAELAVSAKPVQFQAVSRAFLECDDPLTVALHTFTQARGFPADAAEAAKDAAAERHAKAGMLVLLAGGGEHLWPQLRREAWGDPRLRTHLIHAFAACGIPPSLPAARLSASTDPGERAALVLILGGYGRGSLETALAAPTPATVATLYREDPSAEVHAAAEWLLRLWGKPVPDLPIARLAQSTPPPPPEPGWEVDAATGLTFVRLGGPLRFLMGSPVAEPGRSSNEHQHEASIPHSFAIASKVLSISQIKTFLPDALKYQPDLPPDEFPGRFLTLYQARQLCNEVSRVAGLPLEEWAYTEGSQPEPKETLLRLRGYRFPTEAEWEFACRGGSSAPRPYGFAPHLLAEYACFAGQAGSGMQPPGRRRPNGFGLFDMLGNVRNFVEGVYGPYPGDTATKMLPPAFLIGVGNGSFDRPAGSILRGQIDTDPPASFRSAKRETLIFSPSTPVTVAGLRLARTLPSTAP